MAADGTAPVLQSALRSGGRQRKRPRLCVSMLFFVQVTRGFSSLSMPNVKKPWGGRLVLESANQVFFQCLLLENVSALADVYLLVVFQNAPGRPAAQ